GVDGGEQHLRVLSGDAGKDGGEAPARGAPGRPEVHHDQLMGPDRGAEGGLRQSEDAPGCVGRRGAHAVRRVARRGQLGSRNQHPAAARASRTATAPAMVPAIPGSSWTRTKAPITRTNTPKPLRRTFSGIRPARRDPSSEPRIAARVTPPTRAQSSETEGREPASPAKDVIAITDREAAAATGVGHPPN